jgi:TolB protein
MKRILLIVALTCAVTSTRAQQPPPQQPPATPTQPPQPQEIETTITGEAGAPPRLAVPEFIAITKDAETVAIAKTISQVLFDDLNFEREFALIPRDVYSTIPAATSLTDVPFDRWRELNADGLVVGTVQKTGTGLKVELRLFNVRTRQPAYGREYSGSTANPRLYAHQISDELHKTQRGLAGIARTKLVFDSDRDGERIGGTVENRGVKELYISDYDGENQRRVTVSRTLNINPAWSPDGRSIAYTSYRRGGGQIFVSHIFQALLDELTKGDKVGENWLPAWSPDGTRLCFASTRDGNSEIYVMNSDGSNVRRLTRSPGIDISPTWSPTGTQIAFVSDRGGDPHIYIMDADGTGSPLPLTREYSDRPTWSPAPYNEIAYSARTGPGNDIKVVDLATRTVRQLTFGEGTNESPTWSANGRHLAFMSTRAGKSQIFTIARDGKDVRQLTRTGNNQQPNWSK